MERIETANYIARAQRVYRKDSAEYAMLSVEATSPDDALEAISRWCETANEQDGKEILPAMPRYEIVPGSLQEIQRLTNGPGDHGAWARPAGARLAVITLLESGLTDYPQGD